MKGKQERKKGRNQVRKEGKSGKKGNKGQTNTHAHRTCVMEESEGEMVGENCLLWCLRGSTPRGRMSGESWARRRGDVLSGGTEPSGTA